MSYSLAKCAMLSMRINSCQLSNPSYILALANRRGSLLLQLISLADLISATSAVNIQHLLISYVLLTGTEGGEVLVWKLSSQSVIQTLSLSDSSGVLSIHQPSGSDGILTFSRSQVLHYFVWCTDDRGLRLQTSQYNLR